MSKIRQQRTADQILRELSDICNREISDPRLQGLTITDVTIDRELDHADVYVHALGDDSRHQDVMNALSSATGFLRRELAGRMRIRNVPQLHFRWDPTLERAEQVSAILDNLVIPPAADEEE